jgi:shikimate dehydrogenase
MKYGLIGRTLVHSYSKQIHEYLGEYKYELFSMEPEEVTGFVNAHDFTGLNVTIPYKKDVIPLCHEITPLAKSIGAVNTLYWKDGKLIGHNTDYEGFLYAATRARINFTDKTVLILGTGGTSLMAQTATANQGARLVLKASRHGDSQVNLEELGSPSSENYEVPLISYDALPQIAAEIDIIINTTPVGTYPNTMKSVIDLNLFPNCEAVMDAIYNPFRTRLLYQAEEKQLKFTNGLPMLVAQATAAAGYFQGKPGAFDSYNEEIIASIESDIQNIVLVGMPGCGKSTIGKMLAKITGKKFIDMDDEIVKSAGMSIPDIFDKEGELGFRDRETEVAKKLSKEHGQIIATGGGAPLRGENVEALKQNGKVMLIKRPVKFLATSGRPLSKDLDTLLAMEETRMPIYSSIADIEFDNTKFRKRRELEQALRDLTF